MAIVARGTEMEEKKDEDDEDGGLGISHLSTSSRSSDVCPKIGAKALMTKKQK